MPDKIDDSHNDTPDVNEPNDRHDTPDVNEPTEPQDTPEVNKPAEKPQDAPEVNEPAEPQDTQEVNESAEKPRDAPEVNEPAEPPRDVPEVNEPTEPQDKPEVNELDNAPEEEEHPLTHIDDDPITLVERVYQLWWRWADFQLFIITPTIPIISPPIVIPPEHLPNSEEYEFVYPIMDEGYRLRTSKAGDMYTAGMSMCKLYYTVEKMIFILVERLKASGVSEDTEVQVAFGGHELAQRKGFESIINLNFNVVVTNFDPGPWGEHYLEIVKRLADKGYGYPPEAPRDIYRHSHESSSGPKK